VDKVFFEIIHPSDIKIVKDQLAYTDNNNGLLFRFNFSIRN